MASRIRFRRFYECDTESDRSLDFGADSLLYCLDTQKYYRIYNSSYQEVQPDEVIFISPIPVSKLGISGIPDGTKFLRDDGSWSSVSTGAGIVKRNTETFIALAGQTVFTTTTSTTGNQIDVYINGSRLSSSEFYVSGANQITIVIPARAADIVDIVLLLATTDILNPGTGSTAPNVIFVSTNYTPSVTDDALLVNTTMGNSITITLPLTTASNQDGYHIKNIGPGTVIIIGTSSQQIDQQISISISPGSLSSVYIVPYNNNWYII